MIPATSQVRHAREFGGTIGILHEGGIYFAEHSEEAISAFEQLLEDDKKNRDKKRILDEPQEAEAPEVNSFDLLRARCGATVPHRRSVRHKPFASRGSCRKFMRVRARNWLGLSLTLEACG